MPQMLKPGKNFIEVIVKIGDKDDETRAVYRLGNVVKYRSDRCVL